jgi:hypothetical protein
MNARYLNEAKQIEARWSRPLKNGKSLLDGISNRFERANAAVLLENQLLIDKQGITSPL